MSPVSPVDPDVDGDGVVDGADDQDHDDWTNIQERSRSDWPAASFAPLTGQPNLENRYLAVNAYNPCLPHIESRACTQHPPFDEPWAPFDGSLGAPVLGYLLTGG